MFNRAEEVWEGLRCMEEYRTGSRNSQRETDPITRTKGMSFITMQPVYQLKLRSMLIN